MTDAFELLVVGGGPAGLSSVRGYRDAGGQGAVGIVADEQRMPYQRPPLTKELLRGESTEAELPMEEESWLVEAGVSLISAHAVALDVEARTVLLAGRRELSYEHCVLSTGAEPKRLSVPGTDDPAVRVVRTLDHVRELLVRLGPSGRSTVAVIGSGFIGCEIASSLRARGHPVKLISDEKAPNAARLGGETASMIRDWLVQDGVELHLGAGVQRISRTDCGFSVEAGESVEAEVVVMATGVAPRSELAAQAGLELDAGAIPVSASMRTDRDGLLAAGDVCLAENLAARRPLRVEHWGDALKQGEIAGRTAAGESVAWADVPGFWSTIGTRTLKYAAWGDGFDESRLEPHDGAAFSTWYGRNGKLVGVIAYEADEDYERGSKWIAEGAPWKS